MRTSHMLSSVAGALSLSLVFGAAANAAPLLDPYAGVSLGDGKGSIDVLGQTIKPSGFVGSIKVGFDVNLSDRFSIGPVVDYFPAQGLFGNQSFGCGSNCMVSGTGKGEGHAAVDPVEPTDPNVVTLPAKPVVVPIGGVTQVHMKAGSLAYGFRGGVKFGSDKTWSLFAIGGKNHVTGVVKISGHSPFGTWQNKIEAKGNGFFVGGGLEKRIGPHWSTAIKLEHAEITFGAYSVTERVNIASVEALYHF